MAELLSMPKPQTPKDPNATLVSMMVSTRAVPRPIPGGMPRPIPGLVDASGIPNLEPEIPKNDAIALETLKFP